MSKSTLKHFVKRAPVYLAASALVGVSAVMNARYGASLGTTELDRAAWIAASVASDVLKAAAPVALVWSWRNRNAFTGLAAVALLGITVSYSSIAAIGFAASARDTASSERGRDIGRIERAQAAYDAAAIELPAVGTPRPAAAIEAQIAAILANPLADTPAGKCGTLDGDFTKKWCPVVADLRAELANAHRKGELELTMKQARAVLDAAPAAGTSADPQAQALATYSRAIGLPIDAEALRPWLAGLAALLVELGSVFGFLIAGSLGPTRRTRQQEDAAPVVIDTPAGPIIEHEPQPRPEQPAQPDRDSLHGLLLIAHKQGGSPVDGIERRASGKIAVSQRRLADALGRGRRAIAAELEDLAGRGLIAIEATKTGTMIQLPA